MKRSGMKSGWMQLAAIASLTLATKTLAHAAPITLSGSASFADGAKVHALVAAQDRLSWQEVALPDDRRTTIAQLEPGQLKCCERRIHPSPDGKRAIVYDGDRLFELGPKGIRQVPVESLITYSVAFAADGAAFMLVSAFAPPGEKVVQDRGAESLRLLSSPDVDAEWKELGRLGGPELSCWLTQLSLAVSREGPVGICEGEVVELAGGALRRVKVMESGGRVSAVSAFGAPDRVTFFAITGGNGEPYRLSRVVREESGWAAQPELQLPILSMRARDMVPVAADSVVLVGEVPEVGGRTVLYVSKEATGWRTEVVGSAKWGEVVSAVASPPRILAGAIDLRLYERGAEGWTSRELQPIGVEVEVGHGSSCGASSTAGASAAPLGLLLLLALGWTRLRRMRGVLLLAVSLLVVGCLDVDLPTDAGAPDAGTSPSPDSGPRRSDDGEDGGNGGEPDGHLPACCPPDSGTVDELPDPPKPAGVISLTGERMPDRQGRVDIIRPPVINNLGQTAFIVTVSGTPLSEYALVRAQGEKLELVARMGGSTGAGAGTFQPLPGDGVGPFRAYPRLNDLGTVGFLGAYHPTGGYYASELALFVSGTPVAAKGTPSPTYPLRTMFFHPEMSNPAGLGADGTFAFGATLEGDGFSDSPDRGAGVFRGGSLGLVALAHRGDTVPQGGARFWSQIEDWYGFGPPGISPNGKIAFMAREQPDGTSIVRDALYVQTATGIQRLLKGGDAAPGGGALERLYDVGHAPDINSSGDIALWASTEQGLGLILVSRGGSLSLVARVDQLAPGGGIYAHLKSQPSINDQGQVVFGARLREGTLTNREAIFLGTTAGVRPIVSTGDAPPEGGGVFEDLVDSDYFLMVNANRMNLNAQGQLAFMAGIRDPNGKHELGLYVYDGARVRKVVRTGDVIGGKKVADVGFNVVSSPGVRGMNDQCQVAFSVRHADQTYAAWRVNACQP